MLPAARAQAAIEILDRILAGDAAEAALLRWSRGSRYAGSKDRQAVRDLVFDALRRLQSRAIWGGAMSGRGLILGMCREEGIEPSTVFTGQGHGPASVTADELAQTQQPDAEQMLDLPDWLKPIWRKALGGAADQVALSQRERAPTWLRVNTQRGNVADVQNRLEQSGISVRPHADLPTALEVLEGARKISGSASYLEGEVELQDLSPQLACTEVPIEGRILDYCAGGGGKALAFAARGARDVIAHDVDFARMADLPERARRAGANIGLARTAQIRGTFDTVVTDVPCSGSGTWRRTPDMKWRLTEERLAQLIQIQQKILHEAAALVKPGGHLIYMTCSVFQEENRNNINEFMSKMPAFSLVAERVFLPPRQSDGFYLAKLIKA